jgi:hypothetical protein
MFQPASGAPVALAQAVNDSGQTTATLHLLGAGERAGGSVYVQASSGGTPGMNGHRVHGTPADEPGGAEGGAGGDDGGDGGDDGGNDSDAGGGGALRVGSLASFSWNGSSEDYFWLDVSTGTRQDVGTVGDLASWTMNTLAVDYDTGRLYVIGFDASMTQKLYVLDGKTGALVQETAIQAAPQTAFLGVQIVKGPRLVAYYWDGSHEQMVAIDATSGAVTTVGAVGDLAFWSGQTAYDPTADTVYVLGNPASSTPQGGPLTLYSLDATSGALLAEQPITEGGSPVMDVTGVVANSSGTLLGFDWNGSAEEMLALDPKTGTASVLGTVGDLASWDGIATINLTTDTAYVLGYTAAMTPKLYALDGASGNLLYATDLSIPMLPAQATLVY